MIIRKMQSRDSDAVLEMMRVFYSSPAILHKAPEAVLRRDIADCVGECPYVTGYVFESGGQIAGYAMTALGYSTEYGGLCVWVEDLYISPEHRGEGIGGAFFTELEKEYEGKAVRFRLEVERSNERAIGVYEKLGYHASTYIVYDKET